MTDLIAVHISRENNLHLQSLAKKNNCTVDDLINEAVCEYYADEYWEELLEAVGKGEMSDASANQAWYEYINKQDTPQTERINPCPMCGCVPSIRFEIGRGWEVLCKGHNETSLCPTRDWAIQSWNELVEEQAERSE